MAPELSCGGCVGVGEGGVAALDALQPPSKLVCSDAMVQNPNNLFFIALNDAEVALSYPQGLLQSGRPTLLNSLRVLPESSHVGSRTHSHIFPKSLHFFLCPLQKVS
jgi:hypothetical protein